MTAPGIRLGILGGGRMAGMMRRTAVASDAVDIVRPADMPGDPRIDVVYIATRNRDHAALSIAALDAGKAVLCEKPFALGAGDAGTVIAKARQAGLLYMEAVATPFLPAVAAALQAAHAGRLGTLVRLEASFGYPVERSTHARLFDTDGGVVADRAVYPLMLAMIGLGPVAHADIAVERDAQGSDVAARFLLDHVGGGRSDLAVSFRERLDNSLRIEGDAGTVEVAPPLLGAQRLSFTRAGLSSPPRLWRRLRQTPIVRRLCDLGARAGAFGEWHPHGATAYVHELRHFVGLFRAGAIESPVITHDRMLAVARLIEQARTA